MRVADRRTDADAQSDQAKKDDRSESLRQSLVPRQESKHAATSPLAPLLSPRESGRSEMISTDGRTNDQPKTASVL
jgi:hypothetical protein